VAKSSDPSEKRLDELYREHPEEFVAGRNRLAKDLREGGDHDRAEQIKKLRRPTAAAWLVNRAAHDSPKEMREFGEASRQLEDAQSRALEGGDAEAARYRDAAAREREATGAVLDKAEGAARDAGHPASESILERVGQTLRAAAADAELRERVLRGRLDREQSGATLGTLGTLPPRRRDRGAEKRREKSRAQRDLSRLEEDLAESAEREDRLRAQVDRTAEALRQEKSKLADTKRETAALRRKLKAAQRRTGR
jgi:hypothetical protein